MIFGGGLQKHFLGPSLILLSYDGRYSPKNLSGDREVTTDEPLDVDVLESVGGGVSDEDLKKNGVVLVSE